MPSIAEAVRAVVDGVADVAMVAVENAIAGRIEATELELATHPQVVIERELEIPVHLDLLAVPGTQLVSVRRVLSFPAAAAQCRRFLNKRLPQAVIEAANSTAFAAQRVAQLGSVEAAAIASARAGDLYGLRALARSIEDEPGNWTRFALIRRAGT
jgi:prephenate dehydratase